MNNVKKNNKGFSLVELIVVVLIMAIIAVAMAPQVMKWVDNSRLATDVSTYDSLVANCQLALTDSTTYTAVKAKKVTVTFNNTTLSVDDTTFSTQLGKVMDTSQCKSKVKGATYKIEIENGVVKRTTPPNVSTNADLNGGIS